MEDPNRKADGNAPSMSRFDYLRNIRAEMDDRRSQTLAKRQQLEPIVREQVQRLFRDYQPPLYARLRGFGHAQTLALAEATVSSVAAANNRLFTDSETQALTEHFVDSVNNTLLWRWAMTGLAAYMTWRGRKNWQFPFYKPRFSGPYSPLSAGPQIRFLWQSARFAAYYGATWLLGDPIFQSINFMRYRVAMEQDPRLSDLFREGRSHAPSRPFGNQEAGSQSQDQVWKSAGAGPPSKREQQGGLSAEAQSAWATHPRPPASHPPAQADTWGSLADDDGDEASPKAPSTNPESGRPVDYGGSAWERLRQQAQFQPRQDRQPGQKTWEAPQVADGWDAGSQNSSQNRSADNYSFAAADEDKKTSKMRAQQEFDEMVERERRGMDQDRKSWSR